MGLCFMLSRFNSVGVWGWVWGGCRSLKAVKEGYSSSREGDLTSLEYTSAEQVNFTRLSTLSSLSPLSPLSLSLSQGLFI